MVAELFGFRIYATLIMDNEFGSGVPELTFYSTKEEAVAEAEKAYDSVIDGGGSISVHWYDGKSQGYVESFGGQWNGPEVEVERK